MTFQVAAQTPTAIVQNQPYKKPADSAFMSPKQIVTNQLSPQDQAFLVNMPPEALQAWAKHDPVRDFNNSKTRTVTNVVGNAIPYADSYLAGAMRSGPASAKVARSVSTGSDWGVFTGAIWLYNKALGKAYDAFPGMRKFKEDNPTIAMAGEIGTGVLVGRLAIKGWRSGFEKLSGGKSFEQVVENWAKKRTSATEKVATIFKPVTKLVEKFPKLPEYAGLAFAVTALGLIAKNLFDVHKVKKDSDRNLEHLKAQKEEAAKNILNNPA